MMTNGTRLLFILGTLLFTLCAMVGSASAQRGNPPERPYGPTHPAATANLATPVTLTQSGVDTSSDQAEIKLEGPVSVQSGAEFSVMVKVTNAVDLYGLQFALEVDLTKFKILEVTPGAPFGGQTTYQVGPTIGPNGGSLSYAVTLVGQSATALHGEAVLAVVKLQALGASGEVTQVWSHASAKLGNPSAQELASIVTATPLVVGNMIQGVALSLDQPLEDLRVTLVELATGYEIAVVYTGADGTFLLAIPQDGEYLLRANELPFLPAALKLDVTNGVPSTPQVQLDLIYGDWDGDGVITKVDLDRFVSLYYGYELYEWEGWIDIARQGTSLNRFDLRDLYHVAYNNGMTTPEEVRVGWVYGTVTNLVSPLPGATIDVSTPEGAWVATFIADETGFYTFPVPMGNYRLTFDAAGHESLSRAVTVNPLSYRQIFATLPSTSVALDTPIQIDLQWNAVGDMDSWLMVPGAIAFAPGQPLTSVSGVGDPGLSDAHPWAIHTGDVVDSSGTESIVIHRLLPGVYEFWAQKADGDLNAAMNAQVMISGGTHQTQPIHLSSSTGSGFQWQVFTLTVAADGNYVINLINTLDDPVGTLGTGDSVFTLGSKR